MTILIFQPRAFHSESEEELLGMIPSVSKGTPAWLELRELGVAWWVKNDNTLRKLIEKVAKAAFQVCFEQVLCTNNYLITFKVQYGKKWENVLNAVQLRYVGRCFQFCVFIFETFLFLVSRKRTILWTLPCSTWP